ncbi:rhomboid family intramembrane serine protease [Engelhardtia mirabilis]|uniref:Rhomboid family protein n=1 Tax=Engelhardtia mirabilis TaxID=2528011 RepID=A0A518BLN2_9BACT|nr:Rhomboid family protein [Planctomycetes bacterium Pla133]QDV02215.1 Rhomboid family protein [Planctomycetes bacterium Pla86]
MLAFLPFRTDAYADRLPWGTVCLMAVNLVVFLAGVGGLIDIDPLILHWDGIHPLQWVTSVFVHGGWVHLIGNLIFLWTLGQIVEGAVGTRWMLALALSIAVLQGLVEQLLMSGSEGGSFGFSAILFGLLSSALVLAPRTNVDSLVLLGLRIRVMELPLGVLGFGLVAMEVLSLVFEELRLGSAALHLMGALIGLPLAIAGLKSGLLDAGGWDWFTLRERHRRSVGSD